MSDGENQVHGRSISRRAFIGTGLGAAACAGVGGVAWYNHEVDKLLRFPAERVEALYEGRSSELLDRFPRLRGRLAWMPLGTYPTPAHDLPLPTGASRDARLYVKRDDMTSPVYGGNKVRKLEHLLAEARLGGYDALFTVGGLGSNQCLASAIHGGRLGMRVDVCLFEQPVTAHVRRNLLADVAAGANITYGGGYVSSVARGLRSYISLQNEQKPYYIPAGATTSLGNIGHINAGLELAEQVRAGVIEQPDYVFVASGSCGTAAGLLVGLRLAGLPSRIVAVRITEPIVANRWNILRLANRTLGALRSLDPSVPDVPLESDDLVVENRFYGGGYGKPTPEGLAAAEWASPHFPLEQTYTAKAMAAFLAWARERSGALLFWNTFNSAPVAQGDPADLPPELRALVSASA